MSGYILNCNLLSLTFGINWDCQHSRLNYRSSYLLTLNYHGDRLREGSIWSWISRINSWSDSIDVYCCRSRSASQNFKTAFIKRITRVEDTQWTLFYRICIICCQLVNICTLWHTVSVEKFVENPDSLNIFRGSVLIAFKNSWIQKLSIVSNHWWNDLNFELVWLKRTVSLCVGWHNSDWLDIQLQSDISLHTAFTYCILVAFS